MTEIEKIKNNINGETPKGNYDILRVEGIDNPTEVLENFKQAIIVILEHPTLDAKDKKWEQLLPQNMVHIANQMDSEDFANDDLVYTLDSSIAAVKNKNLKEWQWYGSKVSSNSFEVYFEGTFRGRFTWFVRFQGIHLSKITIERDGIEYPLKVYKDFMTYKNLK